MRIILDKDKRQEMRKDLEAKLADDSTLLVSEEVEERHYTICDHLRLLFRKLHTEEQKALCEEIIYLAKRMQKRLQEYKQKYGA